MSRISIITCTYNPDFTIIGRTLTAVAALTRPAGVEVEYIIVDNNSKPAIKERADFTDFLEENKSWVKVITEPKPGLAYGRIAGLKESTGSTIIFFDDDNEPYPDYLEQVVALQKAHPEVGIWSPGDIWVQFMGKVDEWTKVNALDKLQEIHLKETVFTKETQGYPYLPYGTGMVVDREILEEYAALFLAGKYTASDRSGDSLTSTGDIQIVYTAAKFDKAVGRSPLLKLNHLIAESKSSFHYIKRLYYGCSIEGYAVNAQSFPETATGVSPLGDSLAFALRNSWYFLRMAVLRRNPKQWACQTAGMIATVEGKYNYYRKPLPLYLRLLKRKLAL